MHCMSKESIYRRKVENELGNKFFCLKGTKRYDDCNLNRNDSDCYHFQNTTQHMAESNDSGCIILESDEEEAQQVGSHRQSMGGTDVLSGLFSP